MMSTGLGKVLSIAILFQAFHRAQAKPAKRRKPRRAFVLNILESLPPADHPKILGALPKPFQTKRAKEQEKNICLVFPASHTDNRMDPLPSSSLQSNNRLQFVMRELPEEDLNF
jgi:hypothetical protein